MKRYSLIGIDLNLGGFIYPENSVISLDSEPDSFLSKYLVEIPPNSLSNTDDDSLRDESQNNLKVLLVPNVINTVGPVSTNHKQKLKGKFKP